jgi:hypothetical protein
MDAEHSSRSMCFVNLVHSECSASSRPCLPKPLDSEALASRGLMHAPSPIIAMCQSIVAF